jgi:hypothetical protein
MDFLNNNLDSIQQIVLFLLPGFWTFTFFFYLIPAKKKTDFEMLVWTIAISATLSFVTAGLINLINYITHLKTTLTTTGIGFEITTIILGLILAFIFAKLIRNNHLRFINKLLKINIYSLSRQWNVFLSVKEGTVIKVFLNNGINYVGIINEFSADPNDDLLELVLWKPLYLDKNTGEYIPVAEVKSVLIEGSAIVSIEKITDKMAKQIYK